MALLRHLIPSLIVGGLFGWAMSTAFPSSVALAFAAAAAVFMMFSLAFHERASARDRLIEATAPDEGGR